MIKSTLKTVSVLAAVFILCRYVAEFSLSQTLILIVIGYASLLYASYVMLKATKHSEQEFQPFWVRIEPNWHQLLRDYQLVKDDDEYRSLWEKVRSHPASEYNVVRDRIWFTFLIPKPSSLQPHLIYYNSHRCFLTEIDFREEIDEIEILPSVLPDGRSWKPEFYVRPGRGRFGPPGYEFGLILPARWWEKVCADNKDLSQCKADVDHLTGSVTVPIATLPYDEFRVYWQNGDYDPKRSAKLNEHRDKLLTQAGWKRKEPPSLEISVDPPEVVEHRYFTVGHVGI